MTASAPPYRPETAAPYETNSAYLQDALRKLNAVLRQRVAALRSARRAGPAAAGGALYISDEEVDALLSEPPSHQDGAAGQAEERRHLRVLQEAMDTRVEAARRRGVFLGLPQLVRRFALSPFEEQAVLVCLAPELRRAYDTLYAYLQNDITRKRPSIDLVLDLLCETEEEKWSARARLTPQAALRHAGILEGVDDPHSPSGASGLAQFLRLDPRILQFVLGHRVLDAQLDGLVQVRRPAASSGAPTVEASVKTPLLAFARRHVAGAEPPRTMVHLHGPRGVGKRDLALAVCEALGAPMLCLDAARLAARDEEAEALLRRAFRESLLLQAPLYFQGADVFLRDDAQAAALRNALAQAAETYGWLTFLAGETPWPHRRLFEQSLFYSAALPRPGADAREAVWQQALRPFGDAAASGDLAARLAGRFRLTPGQIHEAATALRHRRTVHSDEGAVSFEVLAAACRAQAYHGLDALAVKVEARDGWDDLVLPGDTLAQLRELGSQVRHQERVYQRWGFGQKLAYGKGLSALFSGPPGTGKTMAAGVLARDLQLDLYKVDLARIVSKYIGETEKNLARIFDEAEHSNAILFFDEADALFGKRTDISDAHDRYANIETSYLLQKMEAYDGVVILASNLRENMDSAFLRRIRFLVEFPFPDTESRLEIWQTHFPPEAPVHEAVDYALLAERLQVAGGTIKNIVLNAAFFAAADGGVIGMEHLRQGTRREYEKIGKLWDEQQLLQKKR